MRFLVSKSLHDSASNNATTSNSRGAGPPVRPSAAPASAAAGQCSIVLPDSSTADFDDDQTPPTSPYNHADVHPAPDDRCDSVVVQHTPQVRFFGVYGPSDDKSAYDTDDTVSMSPTETAECSSLLNAVDSRFGGRQDDGISAVDGVDLVDSTATVRPPSSRRASVVVDRIALHGRLFAKRLQRRLVHKDGSCNITTKNVLQRKRRYLVDIFTTFVDMKWRYNIAMFGVAFIGSWFAFALVSRPM